MKTLKIALSVLMALCVCALVAGCMNNDTAAPQATNGNFAPETTAAITQPLGNRIGHNRGQCQPHFRGVGLPNRGCGNDGAGGREIHERVSGRRDGAHSRDGRKRGHEGGSVDSDGGGYVGDGGRKQDLRNFRKAPHGHAGGHADGGNQRDRAECDDAEIMWAGEQAPPSGVASKSLILPCRQRSALLAFGQATSPAHTPPGSIESSRGLWHSRTLPWVWKCD